jgi:signal transduction histidine kinase
MQRNLKRQARDQDLLLRASQTVASQLDLQEAFRTLLQGALAVSGAAGARIVLVSSSASASGYREFFQGDLAEKMASLDEYVVSLVRERSPWAVGNLARERNLFPSYFTAQLGALLAFHLMQSDRFYGALWLAFAQPQVFDQGTLDLLAALASQAAVAASNARLLESAEGGRQRLEAILSAIPDGVLMTDADGRLLFYNAAARELLGAPLPETGQVLPEHGALAELSEALRGSPSEGGNLEMPGADGRELLVSVGNVPGTGSGSLGQVCLIQDVTRFKQLEDLKSEFVHTVSHDLRRPLTQIGGLANMLEMLGPVNSAQQEYIGRIRAAVQNTTRLVEDLLDLSRIEEGVGSKREPVEIRELVTRVVEDFRSEAGSRSVQVTVLLPNQLPKIQADRALLERALGNLIDNAIHFNRAGGSVQVRADVRDEQLLIAVEDTGSGIAPADQGRIFERFYHAGNRDPSSPPGWGLGLAIVKSIADWHQGRVWVESQLGKGSTFYLSLPLSP